MDRARFDDPKKKNYPVSAAWPDDAADWNDVLPDCRSSMQIGKQRLSDWKGRLVSVRTELSDGVASRVEEI